MCCFAALFAWLSPRLAIFMLWIFWNDHMSLAFSSFWIALLGFLFLPWTTLAWAICYAPIGGVEGFGYLVVALGFVVDIGSYTGGARAQRQRSAYA